MTESKPGGKTSHAIQLVGFNEVSSDKKEITVESGNLPLGDIVIYDDQMKELIILTCRKLILVTLIKMKSINLIWLLT